MFCQQQQAHSHRIDSPNSFKETKLFLRWKCHINSKELLKSTCIATSPRILRHLEQQPDHRETHKPQDKMKMMLGWADRSQPRQEVWIENVKVEEQSSEEARQPSHQQLTHQLKETTDRLLWAPKFITGSNIPEYSSKMEMVLSQMPSWMMKELFIIRI